ncbi:MAG TPA: fused MFS/spermidine synthase [Candidatus Saccharimonadales bacterium]|nr:fused MFS/spermidine synthase [Candidatus Saccharimonadales bacterium]
MAEAGALFEGDSAYAHYRIADVSYMGRPARLLYGGTHEAAQSGLALDDRPELLFDYNQRLLELFRGLKPRRVLLIGGGACTLPRALLGLVPNLRLDIVEIDPLLVDLAGRYFGFVAGKHTRISVAEGRQYLAGTEERYDLLVVDAFLGDTMPPTLRTVEAAQVYARHLRRGGVLALNVIAAYEGRLAEALRRQIASLRTVCTDVQIFPASPALSLWLPQNFIVTATCKPRDVAQYMRYGPLSLRDWPAGTPLYDADTRPPTAA